MKITKTIRNSNKLNDEIVEAYLNLARINDKDFEMLYFSPNTVCILKDNSTNQNIKYFNRYTDTFEYFARPEEEVNDCYQITGVDITEFENPFSECFFQFKNNKSKLTDYGNYYFYNMNSNYNGFAKKIWINKTSLLIDSIKYVAKTFTFNVKYEYFDSLKYLDDFEGEKVPFNYDSIVQKFKRSPVQIIHRAIDTLKFINEIKANSRLTLLDFWTIGCEPCIKGFPKIQDIRNSFADNFLDIRAVNPRDTRENILHFAKKHKFTFVLEDDHFNLANYYHIGVFPTTLLIDPSGSVIFRLDGNDPNEFNKLVNEIKTRYSNFKMND